ncbi:hypothetical protein DL93DRAFT_245012 [Clavulina sp. PMI_390]|nr:hypothetical protein DL93DRAFT_245012 [Clavulina sp. PMI_390]
MKKFFGITDANDQAVISLDENSLTIGATHEEGRTLTYDIRLSEIEMILKAIIKELPSYRLWQENCWLFSAIIHRFFAEIEGDSAWGTTRPHWQKSALDAQDRVLSYYWAHRRSQGATPPIPNIGSSASHSSWVQPNFLGGPTTHQPRREYSRDEAEQQSSSFIPRTSSPEPLNDSLPLESFQPISREPTSSEENRQRKIPTISRKRSFGLHFPVPVEQDILGLETFPNTSFPHHRPHKPIPRARRVSFGRTPKLSPEFSAVHPDRSPVACADERKLSPVPSLPIEPPSRAISSANAPIMPPTTSSPSLKRRKVEFEEGYYAEQSDDPHTPTYEHHTKRVCVRTDLFELTSNVKKRSSYDEDSDDDIIIGDEQSTIHTSAAPSRW